MIERKRAEDALAKSEAFLAEGQRISRTGSWAWNVTTGKIKWSKEHCRIFGFDLNQLSLSIKSFLDTIHTADLTRVQAVLDDAVRRGCEFSVEYRIALANGSTKHIHSRGRPVFGKFGEVEEFVGTAMDIDFRYEAKLRLENALAEAMASEDQLRTLIDSMPGLAWTAGPNGEAEFLSQGWLNYVGMTIEEAHGYGWANAIHPDDVGLMVERWQKVIASKRSGEQEARLRRFDGVYRWFSFRGSPLVDQRGNVVKWYGVNVDIEDQKRAEIELRRREEELLKAQAELAHVTRVTTMGELAASIAHEVNQPVAGIVANGAACLRWLSREASTSENIIEARDAVQNIIRDGTRAGEVVDRIRALLKKSGSAKESININEVIRDVAALSRGEILKKNVKLMLGLEPYLPCVLGDGIQLQQVMINLILNGVEAMSEVDEAHRQLVITTQLANASQLLVAVRDFGVGLDRSSLENIFTAFYSTKPNGLGMGLRICRSIVENHGGHLSAIINDGPGATFRFTLPTHSGQECAVAMQ